MGKNKDRDMPGRGNQAVDSARRDAGQATSQASGQANDFSDRARDKSRNMGGRAHDAADRTMDKAKNRAEDMKRDVRNFEDRVDRDIAEHAEEHIERRDRRN